MKKRIIVFILIFVLSVFTLTACGGGGGGGDTEDTCTHDWQAADCETKKTCTKCGETEGELGDHVFSEWKGNDPTCTSAGIKKRECSVCGKEEKEVLDSLGHDLIDHEGKAASCTEDGYEPYKTCKRCDYSSYKVIPKGHKYTALVTPPTCLGGGYTTHTCELCGDSYRDSEVDPHGHAYGAWYQVDPVTATEAGTQNRKCMNCPDFRDRETPITKSGNLGTSSSKIPSNTVKYELFADGTLRISGSGKTFNCGVDGADQPYADMRANVKRIIVCDGITEIGEGSFALFTSLDSFELASSVTRLRDGAFRGAFRLGITRVTIPESVTRLGSNLIGAWDGSGAIIKEVFVENKTVLYPSDDTVFNNGDYNPSVTLFSVGKTGNTTKSYATKIGAAYVDLDDIKTGTVGNVIYTAFNGELSFMVIDPTAESLLPEDAPWLTGEHAVTKDDITSIVIGEGITDIPMEYFKGYVNITSVSIPKTVESIGSRAFSTDSAVSLELNTNFPENIIFLGENIFQNRTNVTVSASWGGEADNYKEDGVTLNIHRHISLLLIGNSLSLDASDNSGGGTVSILYKIMKAMLGTNSYVEIGILECGAKTATWHATVAEQERGGYTFYYISDDTDGKWEVNQRGAKTKYGLQFSNWDYITIQPYSAETTTGVGSMEHDTDATIADSPKDPKFLPLSESLPFLLDYIYEYSPESEVYYYLTWASSNNSTGFDAGGTVYENKMLPVALTAVQHRGKTSNKPFAGIIPAGTAVQTARRTYLGLLNYDGGSVDTQGGLQRDNVHISYHVGRYILGLTFANILIPEEKRVEDYNLPDMEPSDQIGKLPKEYATIAQMAVDEMLKSMKKTGDDYCMPIWPTEYKVDPSKETASKIPAMSFDGLVAEDGTALEQIIKDKILGDEPKSGLKVTVNFKQVIDPGTSTQNFNATVKVTFGYMSETVDITGTVTAPEY